MQYNPRRGPGWPTDVEYSNEYRWGAGVPPNVKEHYRQKYLQRRATQRSKKVYFKRIANLDHPSRGQYGLLCMMGGTPPGMWLLDYVNHVKLGKNQDKSSDYLCGFDDHGKLACDASKYGNELRFINNFQWSIPKC